MSCWLVLVGVGFFWLVVVGSGWCWFFLVGLGCFWLLLAGFGWFWLAFLAWFVETRSRVPQGEEDNSSGISDDNSEVVEADAALDKYEARGSRQMGFYGNSWTPNIDPKD